VPLVTSLTTTEQTTTEATIQYLSSLLSFSSSTMADNNTTNNTNTSNNTNMAEPTGATAPSTTNTTINAFAAVDAGTTGRTGASGDPFALVAGVSAANATLAAGNAFTAPSPATITVSAATQNTLNTLIATLTPEAFNTVAHTFTGELRLAAMAYVASHPNHLTTPNSGVPGGPNDTRVHAAHGLAGLAGQNPLIQEVIQSKVWPLPNTVTYKQVVEYAKAFNLCPIFLDTLLAHGQPIPHTLVDDAFVHYHPTAGLMEPDEVKVLTSDSSSDLFHPPHMFTGENMHPMYLPKLMLEGIPRNSQGHPEN
jgi:hypothetical protein